MYSVCLRKRYEVVEIPLKTQRPYLFMDKETRERVNRETDNGKIRNIVRMVILKDLKTGKVSNFIMVFIGSYDYLIKSKTFGKNSYLHREPDFDGSVLFFDPGKGLRNGWLYRDGKVKRRISANPSTGGNHFNLRNTCWTTIEWIDVEVCDLDANMDDILKNKVRGSGNEWSLYIRRNLDGSYFVSPACEYAPTSGGIPEAPAGTMISYGHSHPGSPGVPSEGDLYIFLEKLATEPQLESMYVYGIGWDNGLETYAINVYDRAAAAAFLNKYPKSENFNDFMHTFMEESELGKAYTDIIKRYNKGYEDHGAPYWYMEGAVAMSFVMSAFNMGVTLTRSVSGNTYNHDFEIINAKNVNNSGTTVLDITVCP